MGNGHCRATVSMYVLPPATCLALCIEVHTIQHRITERMAANWSSVSTVPYTPDGNL